MKENILKNAFEKIKVDSTSDLSQKILEKVTVYEHKKARLKLISFSALGIISLIALFPSTKNLIQNFSNSGFYEYLSVAFSGGGSYWKEISYSLAESIPVASLVMSFLLIFSFIFSLKFGIKQIIKGQLILSN